MKSIVSQAAKQIRDLLKKEFPNVKFTVKSDNYSNGNSIRVGYTNFLPIEKITEKIKHYQYGEFNGMEDIYECSNCIENLPQTKYLFVERAMSEEVKIQILNEIRTTYKDCENVNYEDYSNNFHEWISTLVYRIFYKNSY